jgi:hypothetical protein
MLFSFLAFCLARMAAWQHGSMAAWQHGSMAAWQHGSMCAATSAVEHVEHHRMEDVWNSYPLAWINWLATVMTCAAGMAGPLVCSRWQRA